MSQKLEFLFIGTYVDYPVSIVFVRNNWYQWYDI